MTTNFNKNSSLFLTLFLIWLSHFFIDLMIGIWPIYKTLVNLDLTKAGLIVAIGACIGEGCQVIFGSLSDRGYSKLIIISGVLATAASAFFAYSTAYVILFILYLLTCTGSGAFHPSAAGLVNSLLPARRGLLMAIFASGGSLGLAFSQLIFTNIYQSSPKGTYFLAIPALCLAVLLLLYPFSKPHPSLIVQKTNFRDFLSFFKRSELRCLYISQVANQSLMWGMIFILPDVLKTLGHVDWVCYGGGHMCLILGGTLMMIPSGYLADRYSARHLLLYSSFIAFITFYLFLFSGGISMTLVLLALLILGASLGVANPVAVALGNRLVPEQPGTISAFLMGLVWCISEVIGPGGVGLLSAWFDNYAPVKALSVLGTLFFINIYATIRLPKEVPVLAPYSSI